MLFLQWIYGATTLKRFEMLLSAIRKDGKFLDITSRDPPPSKVCETPSKGGP